MSQQKDTIILITGGHMTPAFAVIEELQSRGYQNIEWVGHKHAQATSEALSAEYEIVTNQLQIPFHELRAGKFMWWITTQNFRYVIRDWFLTPYGFWKARKLVHKIQPDIVVSFGGYLALPVVAAAKQKQIPVVTHEQTLVAGRANRWIARIADKILISWEQAADKQHTEKTVITGNPIRRETLTVTSNNYNFAEPELPVLYITGGNQGSYNVSRRIFRVLDELLKEFNIIHQTGSSTDRQTFTKAQVLRSRLPAHLQRRYRPVPFIYGNEIGEVYAKADILFGRSGANTIAELAALGKLAVLMPIKWSSGGEQVRNAEMLAEIGLATICKQTDAEDEPWRVKSFLLEAKQCWQQQVGFNGEPLPQIQTRAQELINLDAASDIVDELLTTLSQPRE